jgi:uncharacterized membrane protein YbaN (DUF454 family)
MRDTGTLSVHQNGGFVADMAPCREPSVVHANARRVRVHLPHWSCANSEALASAIGQLPGVTGVEANPLTGNVRIDFDSCRTSVSALLDALPSVWLDPAPGSVPSASAVPALVQPQTIHAEDGAPPDGYVYVTGPWRVVYQGLGWASVGMAVVGAIMPGIPTAPFVILAGYFFIKSSRKAHQWLRQARVFGPILRDWEEHRAIRRSVRNFALALISGSMMVILFLGLSLPLTVSIVAMQIIGLVIVGRLRVIDPPVLAAPAQA